MSTTPKTFGDPPERPEAGVVIFKPTQVKKFRPANNPTTRTGSAWQRFWATPEEEANPPAIQPYLGFTPHHMYSQAKMGVRDLAVGTYDLGKDLLFKSGDDWTQAFHADVIAPLEKELDDSAKAWKEGRYSEAAGHYIASYLPFVGPWAVQKGEQLGRRDVGGFVANAGAQALALEAVKTAKGPVEEATLRAAKNGFIRTARAAGRAAGGDLGGAAGEVAPKALLRRAGGAGTIAESMAKDKYTEKAQAAADAIKEKATDIASSNRQALSASRANYEEKVADIEAENRRIEADYLSERQRIREGNENSREAVRAGQEAEQTSQSKALAVSEGLPKLADAEKVAAKKRYPKVEGTVDKARVADKLRKVVDTKLLGAGRVPTSLGGSLDLLEAPDSFIDTEEGPQPVSDRVSVEDLHGMYSEMGAELYSRTVPGDVRAALTAGREVILAEMQRIYNAANKGDEFAAAQRSWQAYENTFRNTRATARTGSPLARALMARDPVTGQLRPDFVRQILSNPREYRVAQGMLHRYGATELQEALRQMKETGDAAKAAPKKVRIAAEPEAPTPKEFPTGAKVTGLKEAPTVQPPQPFDVEKWREETLRKQAVSWQQLRPYNFRPWLLPYTVVQQVLARMLANPRFRDAISRNR